MATSAPSVDISEKEINYCRYSFGVLKVMPQVLRQVFYNRHQDLSVFLLQNRKKCEILRQKNILTDPQWNLLYPTTGSPTLEEFDTTLLYLLLRNLSTIPPPPTGWHKPSMPSDSSLGADLMRLKKIRNDHAHCNDMRMTDSEFGNKWLELLTIVQRLGGNKYKQDMQHFISMPLEDTDSGRTIKREIDHLRKEFQQRIPENIKERGKRLLEQSIRSQGCFVKTKAYRHILKRLKNIKIS